MAEETDVKLVGLTVHPPATENDSSSSSWFTESLRTVRGRRMDQRPSPITFGGKMSCGRGHTSEERIVCGREIPRCTAIICFECERGHETEMPCHKFTLGFKCMTILQGAPPPPPCPHQGKSLVQWKCHEVDTTIGHYLCPEMVEIKCKAGQHTLKVPCHRVAKISSEGRITASRQQFPPCEKPFYFKCKKGLHNVSVPCHQRGWKRTECKCRKCHLLTSKIGSDVKNGKNLSHERSRDITTSSSRSKRRKM